MYYRPLLFVSIVFAAVTATAQFNPTPNIGMIPGEESSVRNGMMSSILGTVRDMDDHPISGARIDIVECTSGRVVATTYTLGTGNFEVRGVPRGDYDVVAVDGIRETRSRVQMPGAEQVDLRLARAAADTSAGDRSSVSLSQMKVPGKARKLFQKALDAFRTARIDDAFALVQKALGMYPDYAQALALRGVMNMQRGDNRSAEPDLQKAVELDYTDDTGFVALASLYNTEGKFDQALQILERGMSVHPTSWQGMAEQARAELGKHEWESALKTLARVDKYAPQKVGFIHLFRAKALLGTNDLAGAKAEIQTYLAIEPNGQNSALAHRLLNQLEHGQTTEAKK